MKFVLICRRKRIVEDALRQCIARIDEEGRMCLNLRPNEKVTLSLQPLRNAQEVQARLDEMLAKGTTVEFAPGELRIDGSKLFEEIEHGGGQLSAKVQLAGAISFSGTDDQGSEISFAEKISGSFTGGREEISFAGAISSLLRFGLGPVASGVGGGMTLNMSFTEWEGHSLRTLPYFNQVHQFLSMAQRSEVLKVALEVTGNSAGYITMKNSLRDLTASLADFVTLIHKARMVCEHCGINPTWKTEFIDENWAYYVSQLYAVLFEERFQQRRRNTSLSTTLVASTINWDGLRHDKPAPLRLIGNTTYKMLDSEIVLLMAHDYSNMLPGQVDEHDDSVGVTFVGNEDTEVQLRLVTDAERQKYVEDKGLGLLKMDLTENA